MKNIHDEREVWIASAITDGLSVSEQKTFNEHLAVCEECKKNYEELKMTSSMLDKKFKEIRPEPGFEDRMITQFRKKTASRKGLMERFWGALRMQFQPRRIGEIALILAAMATLVGLLLPKIREYQEKTRITAMAKALKSTDDQVSHVSKDEGLGSSNKLDLHFKKAELAERDSNDDASRDRIDPSPVRPVSRAVKSAASGLPAESQTLAMDKTLMLSASKEQGGSTFRSRNAAAMEVGSDKSSSTKPLAAQDLKTVASDSVPVESPESQKLIRNANLEIEVASFESAMARLSTLVVEEGGFVATTDSSKLANGKVRGTVVVKVLPKNLEKFLDKLRPLGELKRQTIGSSDVTKEYFDAEARLRNAQRMEGRLIEMLENVKGKVPELLQVEKEIARVREDIERMQGQLKVFNALIQYATVTMVLYEKDMNQPAAFLVKEQAKLSIFASDVEKTFREARQEVDAAKAQVRNSNLNRDSSGRVSAVLSVLVNPDASENLLKHFKSLGRVDCLTWENERIAQGGYSNSDAARVEKDKVQIDLSIVHDDQSRARVSLAVVVKSVETMLEKAKADAKAHNAEILSSSMEQSLNGKSRATIVMRVSSEKLEPLQSVFRGMGRVSQYNVQRNDGQQQTQENENAPVLLSLQLTDVETPSQTAMIRVLGTGVEARFDELKTMIRQMGGEICVSDFERSSTGGENAHLLVMVTMDKYLTVLEKFKASGTVKEFTVKRQDSKVNGLVAEGAPAEIQLHLYSESELISDDNGFIATLKKTFSQSFQSMMNNMKTVSVLFAGMIPWILLIGVPVILVWIFRRNKSGGGKNENE